MTSPKPNSPAASSALPAAPATTTAKPQLIGSKIVYEGRAFKLANETWRMADAQTVQRDVVHHVGAVAVVPFLDKHTVVLVRQFRPAVREYTLEIPAGTLNPGEEPLACAIRETEEETGYKPLRMVPVLKYFTTPGFVNEVMHVYAAFDLQKGAMHLDDDEDCEPVVLSLAALKDKIAAGEIRDAKTLLAVSYVLSFAPKLLA